VEPIDIVIPVYRGEAQTRACIDSVLACAPGAPHEVIVIVDASPEPALSQWLRSLAQAGRIDLIAHERNRGFVATANEGMALHPERDVLLLNSDTEVAPSWLGRIAAHAERDPVAGTVTPFSTNATICSYPRTLVSNPLPAGESTASLDEAFAAANAGRGIEIPTAVGFCMYIARRCLERIGCFDEARYGTGYGEEVDFCMRAARAGFRNKLAGDAFVRHVGEVSFGSTGADRRSHAQRMVDTLYPEFQEKLRFYIPADPARELRRRADLERLRRLPRPRMLIVASEPDAAASDEAEHLTLSLHGASALRLRWPRPSEEFELWLHAKRDLDALDALLRIIGIAGMRCGDAAGMPPAVLKRIRHAAASRASPEALPELQAAWLKAPTPEEEREADRSHAVPSTWGARAMRTLRRLVQRS
jgi:GT2 family glycosyltransferase